MQHNGYSSRHGNDTRHAYRHTAHEAGIFIVDASLAGLHDPRVSSDLRDGAQTENRLGYPGMDSIPASVPKAGH
jgi:hypothetical protein